MGAPATINIFAFLGTPGALNIVKYDTFGTPGALSQETDTHIGPGCVLAIKKLPVLHAGAFQPLNMACFAPWGVSAIRNGLLCPLGRFSHLKNGLFCHLGRFSHYKMACFAPWGVSAIKKRPVLLPGTCFSHFTCKKGLSQGAKKWQIVDKPFV